MRTTRCVLGAHAGHEGVDAVEDFEDGADALLAVRLHGADFGQRGPGVGLQRGVPDDARHVLQTGGEAAELLAAQAVLAPRSPATAPTPPRRSWPGRSRSSSASALGRPGLRRARGAIEHVGGQLGGIGIGGPGQQLAQTSRSSSARCPAWRTARQTACSSRSSSVRPRKASGRRRSVGRAQ